MGSPHLHLDRPAAASGAATADLRREHEVILRALALLESVADGLASARAGSDAALGTLVEFLQAFADRCHHGKEEAELFPAMRAKGMEDVLAPFLEEHEEGRGYVRTLAGPASGPERAAAARRYVGMLRDHIQRENEALFPLADGLFTRGEHAALADAYAGVERRIMGADVHDRWLARLAALEAEMGLARPRA